MARPFVPRVDIDPPGRRSIRIGGVHPRLEAEQSVIYDADGAEHPDANWAWRKPKLPSIHMPRGLSRIMLEVTDVRVERLQEITEEDARAEGCEPSEEREGVPLPARAEFAVLWDSINTKRAPWNSNPWVWVVAFEVAA